MQALRRRVSARYEGARRAQVAQSMRHKQKKQGLQQRNTDVETALAALNEDNDTDLEETDVQEILLAYKESRQLRGEQRVNSGYKPVTGRTSGGKPYRVEGQGTDLTYPLSHMSRERTLRTRMPKQRKTSAARWSKFAAI